MLSNTSLKDVQHVSHSFLHAVGHMLSYKWLVWAQQEIMSRVEPVLKILGSFQKSFDSDIWRFVLGFIGTSSTVVLRGDPTVIYRLSYFPEVKENDKSTWTEFY